MDGAGVGRNEVLGLGVTLGLAEGCAVEGMTVVGAMVLGIKEGCEVGASVDGAVVGQSVVGPDVGGGDAAIGNGVGRGVVGSSGAIVGCTELSVSRAAASVKEHVA